MQKAELILTKLYHKSRKNQTFKFRRLYRNLFNTDFYLQAYAKIHSKEGNMTTGVDGKTIDGFSLRKVEKMITMLKREQYYPTSVRRVYIPKKNGKKRPLGIPTFEDKLLQEVLRQILEAVYEPTFSNRSHGFRPQRSCHTALQTIKKLGSGAAWAIEGDISAFFDTIDHTILLNIIKRRIDDGRIIELLRRFLKAGYMEHNIKRNTITGTPAGGIISPLLANIYLHELDKYMEELTKEYWKGTPAKRTNKVYTQIQVRMRTLRRNGKIKEALTLRKQLLKTPSSDPISPEYRRVQYVRYADDFVIFLIGPKAMAREIKDKVSTFLREKLNIRLNDDKTLITNLLKRKVRFLGYQICKAKNDTKVITDKLGRKRRSINGIIQLLVPADVIHMKTRPFKRNNKPAHRSERINATILEIISHYNSEIRGLYNYYSLGVNVSKRLNTYKYYHYYSMIRTIAAKEKSSVRKMVKKYGVSVKRKNKPGTRLVIGCRYILKNGTKKTLTYYTESLVRKKVAIKDIVPIPDDFLSRFKCQLLERISNYKCELCKETKSKFDIEVHHVRKLKDLKRKWKNNKQAPAHVKLMIKMNRKTLVLCKRCHVSIHV